MVWTRMHIMASTRTMSWEQWLLLLADVSRPLTIAIFGRTTVDEQWEIRPRRIPEHLLYMVLEGVVTMHKLDLELRLEPWSLLWIPAGVEHAFRALRRPMTLYHLRFLDSEAPEATPRREPLLLHGRRELLPIFARLYDEYRARLPLRDHAFRAALVHAFCLIRRAEAGHADGGGLDERRRARVGELVHLHLARGLTPRALAVSVGLSPTHFTRLFTRTYGVAPRTWLMHERVRRAAQELRESDASIGAVAARQGFADIFIFSRQFSHVMGLSPSAWRRKEAR
jgi:AraC-like DNA-binding protein/mannose-6-phosphate isomerase-like protein (cupin superfamily)